MTPRPCLPACCRPAIFVLSTHPTQFPSPLTACPYLCRPTTTRRCRAAAAAWAVRATGGQPSSHLVTTQQKLYSPKCPFAQLAPRPNTGRGPPHHEPASSGQALRAPESQDGRLRQGTTQHGYCVASRRWKKGRKTLRDECCDRFVVALTLYLAVWAITTPEARHQALFLPRLLTHDVKILRDATIIAVT